MWSQQSWDRKHCEDLRRWAAERGWSALGRQVPPLAAAAGWPRYTMSATVVSAVEGAVSGRRTALVRSRFQGGEGEETATVVWAELRRATPDRAVTLQRRLFPRRLRRSSVTGDPYFDRMFKVWPRDAAPALSPELVATAHRFLSRYGLATLAPGAPGAVEVCRHGWLAPREAERLLADVVALAAATDGGPAAA